MATCASAGVLPRSSGPAVPIVITLTGAPLRFVPWVLLAVLPPVHPDAASRTAAIRAMPAAVADGLLRLILIVRPPLPGHWGEQPGVILRPRSRSVCTLRLCVNGD